MKIINLLKAFVSLGLLPLVIINSSSVNPKQQELDNVLKEYNPNIGESWANKIDSLDLHPKEFEELVKGKDENDIPIKIARVHVNLAFAHEIATRAYNVAHTKTTVIKALSLLKKLKGDEAGKDSIIERLLKFAEQKPSKDNKETIKKINELGIDWRSKVVRDLRHMAVAPTCAETLRGGNLEFFGNKIKLMDDFEKDSFKNLVRENLCPIFTEKTLLYPTSDLIPVIKERVEKCFNMITWPNNTIGNTFPTEYLLGLAYLETEKVKDLKESRNTHKAHDAEVRSIILMSQVVYEGRTRLAPIASESFIKYYKSKLDSNQKFTSEIICAKDIEFRGIKITTKSCSDAMNYVKKLSDDHDKYMKALYFEQNAKEALKNLKNDKEYVGGLANKAKEANKKIKNYDPVHYPKLNVNRYYICVNEQLEAGCWMHLCAASLYQSDLHDITRFMCYQSIKEHAKKRTYNIPTSNGTTRLSTSSSADIASSKQTQEVAYVKELVKAIKPKI